MILESFRFEDENEYDPESFNLLKFLPKKLVRLFILKEVKPSPDSKMIKLLTLI